MFGRALIIAILGAFLIGGGLVYLRNEYKTYLTVEVVDAVTGEYLENARVSMTPSLPLKFDSSVSGKGRFIYQTDHFMPVFLSVSANGYKTYRRPLILFAEKVRTIQLDKIGVSSSKNKTIKQKQGKKTG